MPEGKNSTLLSETRALLMERPAGDVTPMLLSGRGNPRRWLWAKAESKAKERPLHLV